MRIAITGVPKAGKTTLSDLLGKVLGYPVYHTDVTKEMEWSEASDEVSGWFEREGPWIIEGVVVPRGLRKWSLNHAQVEPPLDRLIIMRNPKEPLTLQGQQTMAKTVIGLIDTYRDWIGERWVEL